MNHHTVAVIDIGSNSIRLVVYRLLDGIWQTLINEKSAVRLGEGVAATGEIQAERLQQALENLHRFKTLANLSNADVLVAIATSAVREADNGPDFVRDAASILGLEPKVLSGQEEAEYAAAGVQWAIPQADGIVCDLGGSSLEIMPLNPGADISQQAKLAVSLDIGPLRLFDLFQDDRRRAKAYVDNHIKGAVEKIQAEIGPLAGKRIYSVGGAWRALGLLHMRQNLHPLSMVHRYAPALNDFLKFNKPISQMKRDDAMTLAVSQADRRIALPYAALILRRLVKWTGAQSIEFCSVGIREGALSKHHNVKDAHSHAQGQPLQAVKMMVQNGGRFGPIGDAMMGLVDKAYAADLGHMQSLNIDRVIESCHLADFGWDATPTHKKHQSYSNILNSAVLTHSHAERITLAAIQFYRHKGRSADVTAVEFGRLLSTKEHKASKALGRFIRLAMQISRAQPSLLEHLRLEITSEQVAFIYPAHWFPQHASGVKTACEMLGDACNKKVRLRAF